LLTSLGEEYIFIVRNQKILNSKSETNGQKLSLVKFLADRTNGRAIATLLRLSSSVVVCRL